jgi:hypothetical protein
MKLFYKIVVSAFAVASLQANAQIKNAKTETLTVYGNCGMCKTTIEKAATEKKVSEAAWDKESHKLTLTYDSEKTTSDALLKKVAYAGYDNEKYLAPLDAYNRLPGCCRYERSGLVAVKQDEIAPTKHNSKAGMEKQGEDTLLGSVYTTYFLLKDALVSSDGIAAATAAAQLTKALEAVPMDKMQHSAHMVWMKNLPSLKEDAAHIAGTNDVNHQRDHFVTLSGALYVVVKAFEPEGTLYYQHCPMYNDGKGANWLSRDKEIRNPYYGAQMLSCGKTVETLQ